jgi:hypothetical protein
MKANEGLEGKDGFIPDSLYNEIVKWMPIPLVEASSSETASSCF